LSNFWGRSDSHIDFTYRGKSYRFKLSGGIDAHGASTVYIASMFKPDPDDEHDKPIELFGSSPRPNSWLLASSSMVYI
jgi:hypothetical protein